jgi:predicted metal-dependent HD superfamily phosphohydrolase
LLMTIVEEAEEFVRMLLKDKLSASFLYHNFNHTANVVEAVKHIIDASDLNQQDEEQLLLAAWFHDTGYVVDYKNHEQLSVDIVSGFLKDKNYPEDYIAGVTALIEATSYGYIPHSLGEKIIRDADYAHFISDSYIETSESLRKEWELTQNKQFTDLEWMKGNLELFTKHHHYYTDFANRNWLPLKEKNASKISALITQMEQNMEPVKPKKEKKKNKEDKYEKGIDTMFKTTLTNHIRLSEIADSKANILLSVNAIIISIALSTLIPKLDSPTNVHLIIPTFVMLLFSVVCIISAILSTRPKITSGAFTRQDILDKKVNLLFFGNFYKMPYEEYQWAINELLNDKEYLYTSMTKDLYHLGLVLERKYRWLRITYNLFMFGIIVSVVAFVIAFKSMGV